MAGVKLEGGLANENGRLFEAGVDVDVADVAAPFVADVDGNDDVNDEPNIIL